MAQYIIDKDYKFIPDDTKPFFSPNIICHTSNFKIENGFNKIQSMCIYEPIISLHKYSKVLISLSGGVDSLVCLHLYNNMYPNKVSALHINYMNRETHNCEEAFVKYMCRQMGITLYVRRIEEVQRSRDKTREDYEKYTNELRFNLYRQFKDHLVILGHNYDDCLENVFSNIKKNKNLDNLFGMDKISIIRDVPIYRPLLDVTKTKIIEYAHHHNMPYLEDSTPKWSERGRMRDNLIPAINDYSPDICKNLHNIRTLLMTLYNIWDVEIKQIKIYQSDNSLMLYFNDDTFYSKNINWLNRMFQHLNKTYNISIPKSKVLIQLLNFKENTKITYGKSKYIKFNDNILYICH